MGAEALAPHLPALPTAPSPTALLFRDRHRGMMDGPSIQVPWASHYLLPQDRDWLAKPLTSSSSRPGDPLPTSRPSRLPSGRWCKGIPLPTLGSPRLLGGGTSDTDGADREVWQKHVPWDWVLWDA